MSTANIIAPVYFYHYYLIVQKNISSYSGNAED